MNFHVDAKTSRSLPLTEISLEFQINVRMLYDLTATRLILHGSVCYAKYKTHSYRARL